MAKIKAKHAAQIRRGIELHRTMRFFEAITFLDGFGGFTPRTVLAEVEDAPELTQRAFDRQLAKEAAR